MSDKIVVIGFRVDAVLSSALDERFMKPVNQSKLSTFHPRGSRNPSGATYSRADLTDLIEHVF
jgi:hypothetical protein